MYFIYDVNKANAIKKVYDLQNINDASREDVEFVFLNYFYYVNPKNYEDPYEEHYMRLHNYFEQEIEKGTLDTKSREEIRTDICKKVIKELFDLEYFEKRLEYHKNHNDKECLFEYMNMLNVNQLKELLPILLGSVFVFSWNEKAVEPVWKLLNEACLKKDTAATVTTEIYDEYGYFNKKIPMYFFDYLDKETVINLVCNSICDENKYNAATLTRLMYTDGIEEVKYTESVWWCDC